jgi:hypothetical protein
MREGDDHAADVAIIASATADELRFHEPPEARTRFAGSGARESRRATTRRNVDSPVQHDLVGMLGIVNAVVRFTPVSSPSARAHATWCTRSGRGRPVVDRLVDLDVPDDLARRRA